MSYGWLVQTGERPPTTLAIQVQTQVKISLRPVAEKCAALIFELLIQIQKNWKCRKWILHSTQLSERDT